MSTDQHHRRLDRIEQATGTGDGMPMIMFGPTWAQSDGADPPPDDLEDPVWSKRTGWIEKAEMTPNGVVCLYAPEGANAEDG